MKPLAIITGVGPGTGAALARRFHKGGYRVAMIARNADRLAEIAHEMHDSLAMPTDVANSADLLATLDEIKERAGAPRVVIHNAVGGAFGNFLDISPDVLARNFEVNVMALLHLARWSAPKMAAEGEVRLSSRATPRPCADVPRSRALRRPRRRSESWPNRSRARWGRKASMSLIS